MELVSGFPYGFLHFPNVLQLAKNDHGDLKATGFPFSFFFFFKLSERERDRELGEE